MDISSDIFSLSMSQTLPYFLHYAFDFDLKVDRWCRNTFEINSSPHRQLSIPESSWMNVFFSIVNKRKMSKREWKSYFQFTSIFWWWQHEVSEVNKGENFSLFLTSFYVSTIKNLQTKNHMLPVALWSICLFSERGRVRWNNIEKCGNAKTKIRHQLILFRHMKAIRVHVTWQISWTKFFKSRS